MHRNEIFKKTENPSLAVAFTFKKSFYHLILSTDITNMVSSILHIYRKTYPRRLQHNQKGYMNC